MVKCVRLFQPLNESELLPPQPLQELQSSMENFKQKRKFREGEEKRRGRSQELRKENITEITHLMIIQIFVQKNAYNITVERGDNDN